MSAYPCVSVIVPCYNQQTYIAEAIDSVLAQTYPNIHLIVSDDASQDQTPEILKTYKEQLGDRMTLQLHPHNLGITNNCASCLSLAQSSYVVLFAGDDVMLPDKITQQVASLEAQPDAAFCYHNVEVFDGETGRTLYLFNQPGLGHPPLSGDLLPPLLRYQSPIALTSLMINRRVAPQVTFRPHTGLCSDWTLCVELSVCGPGLYIPQVLGRYRRHKANASRHLNPQIERYDRLQLPAPYARDILQGKINLLLAFGIKALGAGSIGQGVQHLGALLALVIRNPQALPWLGGSLRRLIHGRLQLRKQTGRWIR